jgi:hypothetical protein
MTERLEAVQTMMGVPLAALCEKADAVVLIFGTGCIFLRPDRNDDGTRVEGKVECPPIKWTIDYDHPGGTQRIHGLSVKAIAPKAKRKAKVAR